MPIREFPDPNESDKDGLVALGGDLHPDSLVLAYRSGIFPWPAPGLPIPWFSPDPRAILEYKRMKPGRTLERAMKRLNLSFTIDRAFPQVIENCQRAKRADKGTWITPEMKRAYLKMHVLGYAHSAEVWDGTELVGGLYGIAVDGVFSGESMFHTRDNASKIALMRLMEYLHGRGLDWMDIQMLTPHLERLGAREIPRADYLNLLKKTQSKALRLF